MTGPDNDFHPRVSCARLLLLLVILWLGAAGSAMAANRGQPLEQWLGSELLPYLADRFGRHPRLKGEPFEVVAMKESQVVGEMDGLTDYLKSRIVDRLQAVPGANLVWRPAIKPWVNNGRFMELECHAFPTPTIQLGIEVEPLFQGYLRVSVQAVDLEEKSWVRGLKRVWVGRPSAGEIRLLRQKAIDIHLLGSRSLPFRSDQSDLMLLFLARKLGCMLQDLGQRQQRILAQKVPAGLAPFFKTTFDLVQLRLGRFREIQMASTNSTADKVLFISVHRINGNLDYVWIGLRDIKHPRESGELAAEAYVRLHAGQTRTQAGRPGPLIARFELITPSLDPRCRAVDPWSDGISILASGERLMNGDCFAIRYQARRASWLFLFAEMSNGNLYRLFPDRCDALEMRTIVKGNWVQSGQTLHLPFQGGHKGHFSLDMNPGIERLYAVAVANHRLALTLPGRLGIQGDLCGPLMRGAQLKNLGQALDQLAREGDIAWQVRTIVHVAR